MPQSRRWDETRGWRTICDVFRSIVGCIVVRTYKRRLSALAHCLPEQSRRDEGTWLGLGNWRGLISRSKFYLEGLLINNIRDKSRGSGWNIASVKLRVQTVFPLFQVSKHVDV